MSVELQYIPPAPKPVVRALGDVIGGSSYFGHCPSCGTQFMSTADRVVVIDHECYCLRCGGVR